MWLTRLRRRLRAARTLQKEVALWYHPEYRADSLRDAASTVDFQTDRVEHALRAMESIGIPLRAALREPQPATIRDLTLVHDAIYVERTADPRELTRIFGTPVIPLQVDDVLRSQRLAVGGTIDAALSFMRGSSTGRVAFNLGGGFHHAEQDHGGGFCVFNDIAIAIARLRLEGFTDNILIIDLDFHEGNGNLKLFAHDSHVAQIAINGAHWAEPVTSPQQRLSLAHLPPGTTDDHYMECLRPMLQQSFSQHRPKMVFYIAGSDVMSGDRLGTFSLSLPGILKRDQAVMEMCRIYEAKCVITMAGGYHPDAWKATANLLYDLLTSSSPPQWPDLSLEGDTSISSRGGKNPEPSTEPLHFTEADLLGDLTRIAAPLIFLDFESEHALEMELERKGVLQRLRDRGYSSINVTIARGPAGTAKHFAHIDGSLANGQAHRLIELEVHRERMELPRPHSEPLQLWLLAVDWLLIQDPSRSSYPPERPRLPGQNHPGLGVSDGIRSFLLDACKRAGCEGVANIPSHYHSAVLASRQFHFADPKTEARLLAIKSATSGIPVAVTSQLLENGMLKDSKGNRLQWSPQMQIQPVSPRLQAYFASGEYRAAVREALTQEDAIILGPRDTYLFPDST